MTASALTAFAWDSSLLVRLFGWRVALIHGDPAVLDRWLWLVRRLPRTRNGERLLDVGCGTGAFTIGVAHRGYRALGLSWDERNQRVAAQRARLTAAEGAAFDVLDVRRLDERADLVGGFDVVICLETVEHIVDDRKLFLDMARCLKPGGRLLLTTPSHLCRPLDSRDLGPFCEDESGWHVRRGYSGAMLQELCSESGLAVEELSFCTGVASQRLIAAMRRIGRTHHLLGWAAVLPLRWLPPLLDPWLSPLLRHPPLSIALEAYKPRYGA
jgi:SAM-dependent methyltransferase